MLRFILLAMWDFSVYIHRFQKCKVLFLSCSSLCKLNAKCLNKTSRHGSQNQAIRFHCWSVLFKSGLRHTGSRSENTASQPASFTAKWMLRKRKIQAGYLIKRRMGLTRIWQQSSCSCFQKMKTFKIRFKRSGATVWISRACPCLFNSVSLNYTMQNKL